MSRGPDASTLLARAIEAAGMETRILDRSATRWASATFCGARHSMTIAAPDSPAVAAWLHALPEAEFHLNGHLVADIHVDHAHRVNGVTTIKLEALTVET